MRYRIKDEAWLEFLKQNTKDLSNPNPGYQEVLHAPDHHLIDGITRVRHQI